MAHRDNEGRELLLQVRDSTPEDPQINVELGRISARQRTISEVLRYYHNALYGIWTGEDVDHRRQEVRRELIEFLISENAKEQALAETVALAAHLPDTPTAHLELGDLFSQVDDAANALQSYSWALHREPGNQMALRGAGEAAFKTGNYRQAKRLLSALAEPDSKANETLETANLVLESDPLEPRLADSERVQRVKADLEIAKSRIEQCLVQKASLPTMALQDELSKLMAQQQIVSDAWKRRDPNFLFSSFEVIYNAESAISNRCGPMRIQDTALLLMSQKNRGLEQ
jgi:tetratricopeptide (TPR) repeat protein